MDTTFAYLDAWMAAVILAVTMLAAYAIGWSRGRRLPDDERKPPASRFEDATLALLGLLLAFSYATAIGKHDQRRHMVVADSNAIGDFYTCASLLREPVRSQLQTVTREYTEYRINLAQQFLDAPAFENALQRIQTIHVRMTELVAQALDQGTPVAVPLTNTLNDLTSIHAARLAAIKDRLPTVVVLLLFMAAVVSSMLVGHQQGASGRMQLGGTLSFILLVSLAVYVTLDLNQPSRGLITVSQEPLQRLLSSMTR